MVNEKNKDSFSNKESPLTEDSTTNYKPICVLWEFCSKIIIHAYFHDLKDIEY